MARRKHRYLTSEEIAVAKPHELILSFLDLAEGAARRARPGCEDTRQDAKLGLVRAAENYRGSEGAFVPYATLWIKQAINRGVGARRYLIHLPEVVRKRLAVVNNVAKTLADDATPQEIADALGSSWGAEEVEKLLALPQATSQSENEEGITLEERAADAATAGDFDIADARMDLTDLAGQMPRDLAADIHQWLEDSRSDKWMRQIAAAADAHLTGDVLL